MALQIANTWNAVGRNRITDVITFASELISTEMSTVYMTLFACPPPKPIPVWNGKKTVVITGGNRGIGFAAAKLLSETDTWDVVIACRSKEKALAARQSLGKAAENVEVCQLDLSDLQSVRNFATRWGTRRLDCLALNAGIHTGIRQDPMRSAQGYETTMATNHLGHFQLMKLLLPNVERTQGRIVYVGSSVHNPTDGRSLLGNMEGLKAGFRDPVSMIDNSPFDADKAYRDSKLCNIVTTLELSRRLKAKNSSVTCNCLSPGLIPTTGLFREYNPCMVGVFNFFMRYVMNIAVSEEEGGRRLAYLIDSPEVGTTSGAYFARKKGTNELILQDPSHEAQDKEKAKELWALSERLIRQLEL